MISFIVPAHNEQASLGRTPEAIHKAARAVGQPYEIIVLDSERSLVILRVMDFRPTDGGVFQPEKSAAWPLPKPKLLRAPR